MKLEVKPGSVFLTKNQDMFLSGVFLQVVRVDENVVIYAYKSGVDVFKEMWFDRSLHYFTTEYLEPVGSLTQELF